MRGLIGGDLAIGSLSRVWTPNEAADRIRSGDMMRTPFWSSVVFHAPMEEANNSTAFTDAKGATATVNGNATIKTDSYPFGTSAGYFDGTGDYVTYPDNAAYEFDGDFFIRTLFAPIDDALDISQPILIAKHTPGETNYWDIQLTLNQLYWSVGNGTTEGYYNFAYGKSILGGWHEAAVGRQGSTAYMWMDGKLLVSFSTVTYPAFSGTLGANTSALALGARSDGLRAFNGRLKEPTIVKGLCPYTGDYAPAKRLMYQF